MIIGIDGNEANVKRRVGIGEYAFELLWQFSNSKLNPSTSSGLSSTLRLRPEGTLSGVERVKTQNSKLVVYLKDRRRSDLPKENQDWQYRVIGPKKLWTQVALPIDLYLHKPKPDVFFSPTHYAPRFSPVPTVISIMDLSYIQYPALFKKSDLYQLKSWTAYSVRNAKRVLTISKASKNDIIKEYQVTPDKVVVTYPGIKSEIRNPKFEINLKFNPFDMLRIDAERNRSIKMQNSKMLKEKYEISGEYVLFVGTLQPRKNIVRLIEAFSLVCHPELVSGSQSKRDSDLRQNDMKLVIVGKKGWLYEEILEAPKKFGVENKVKFLDFVSDEELSSLYRNALCFVLPSLYEGFGLPVLEAMKYGCPVITSNVSSLPEAGGDAALYVDPEDVSDIADNLRLMLEKPQLRKELIKKGYEQVKKFSWEKTARETLRVLEKVASGNA